MKYTEKSLENISRLFNSWLSAGGHINPTHYRKLTDRSIFSLQSKAYKLEYDLLDEYRDQIIICYDICLAINNKNEDNVLISSGRTHEHDCMWALIPKELVTKLIISFELRK